MGGFMNYKAVQISFTHMLYLRTNDSQPGGYYPLRDKIIFLEE
jgi:hypothetical protein